MSHHLPGGRSSVRDEQKLRARSLFARTKTILTTRRPRYSNLYSVGTCISREWRCAPAEDAYGYNSDKFGVRCSYRSDTIQSAMRIRGRTRATSYRAADGVLLSNARRARLLVGLGGGRREVHPYPPAVGQHRVASQPARLTVGRQSFRHEATSLPVPIGDGAARRARGSGRGGARGRWLSDSQPSSLGERVLRVLPRRLAPAGSWW